MVAGQDILHKEVVDNPDLQEEGLEANILDQEVDLVDIRLDTEQVQVQEDKMVAADPGKAELEIHLAQDKEVARDKELVNDDHRDVHGDHAVGPSDNFLARD